jgi:hypothetical protein
LEKPDLSAADLDEASADVALAIDEDELLPAVVRLIHHDQRSIGRMERGQFPRNNIARASRYTRSAKYTGGRGRTDRDRSDHKTHRCKRAHATAAASPSPTRVY